METLEHYPTRAELVYLLEKLERIIDDNAKLYRDQILTKMEEIVGDYDEIREENIFRDKEISDLQKKAEEHDREIAKLIHT